ncbi:MAG: PPC domain-containing protein [Armatimonadia bacterium]
MALVATGAWAQVRTPYGGYLYPAGARQGTTAQVEIGGQNLQGVLAVHVSGEGVQTKVVEYVRPLNKKQLRDAGQHIQALMRQRWAELTGRPVQASPNANKEPLPELPDHPLLRGLDKMSLKQLQELQAKLFDPKVQPNAQIAETVVLQVTVAQGAALGMRELRVQTPIGLSNPVRFEVSGLPEVAEQEPNALDSPVQAVDLPAVFNGQIRPGDTDCFRFLARKGQKLVMTTEARALIPYLADAVPGWFQATLAVYDGQGKELAFDDDYRFNPDPVLRFDPPADGEYVVEIRDAIYRGREDFVYRLSVGELPFVTRLYPLGGKAGAPFNVALWGWNLPMSSVTLQGQADTPGAQESLREVAWQWPQGLSNRVQYAVDTLPEALEVEPNDDATNAQKVTLPVVVNARIMKAGDVDEYRFEGKAGEEVVAEITARRVGSPLDSLVRVSDAAGQVLGFNDDCEDPSRGLMTHHADSYVTVRLPKKGTYTVQVLDTQQHGGDEYGYRLRLSGPRPDFALRMTPSSLQVPAGRLVPLCVHVLRKEGFQGEVEVGLSGAPVGFSLTGGRIPAGRDKVWMALATPGQAVGKPVAIRLEGKAKCGEAVVTRPVVPTEDMMQAFAYQHLVPSQELAVMVTQPLRMLPPVELVTLAEPLKVPAGGVAQVELKTLRGGMPPNLKLELKGAPEGLSIKDIAPTATGATVTVEVKPGTLKPGYVDNLLIETVVEMEARGGQGRTQKWRVAAGVLPVIPFEIVK